MDSSSCPPQVVTLELRSLEQRLNHGSLSAGAMDEANEAMAKAQRDFGREKGGFPPGENVGKTMGNYGKIWEKVGMVLNEFGGVWLEK